MKHFTRFSIGRPAGKFLALALLVGFAVLASAGAVEFVKAQNTTGAQSAYHQNESDKYTTIALAILVIPAIHSMRMTTSLGLQWTRTEETLIEHLRGDKSDPALAQKYLNRQLRFRDVILYRSILVDGFSGIQKVWDSTVSKAAGVTNVDRAKLDKDVTCCIDTILIGYANSGGAGTDPSNIAGYDYVVTSWPAGLRNAEVTIMQDSNPILEDHPVQSCGSMADSTFGLGRAEGYLLKSPFILEGDKNFEVRINFPQSIAAANTDFIRIDLYGIATRKRGML